jgi:hypothetical protein
MALSHSPQTVTNGLVFYYDMGNPQKSWKGAPTTNLAKNSSNQIDWSVQNLLQSVSTSTIVLNEVYRIASTSGTGTSFRIRFNNAVLVNGATYTVSYKYRFISNGPLFRATDWCDQAITRVVNEISPGVFYESATGTRATYDSTFRFLDFEISNNTVVEIWDLQLEERSFATPYSSTQVRSNTQSILDLTNNNTVTANSLTYASNNTFSFNGTTDFINAGNTFTFAQSSQFSAEVWLKILDHSDRPAAAAGIIGKGHFYDNQWDIWLYNNNSIYFETAGNPTRQGQVYLASPVLALNTWHHYVATYNNGAKSIYLNGNLVGTQTYTGPGDFSNTNNVLIGRRFNDASRSLRGDVSVAKIYNRALSAAEVQQNFNALRSRYGI